MNSFSQNAVHAFMEQVFIMRNLYVFVSLRETVSKDDNLCRNENDTNRVSVTLL